MPESAEISRTSHRTSAAVGVGHQDKVAGRRALPAIGDERRRRRRIASEASNEGVAEQPNRKSAHSLRTKPDASACVRIAPEHMPEHDHTRARFPAP